MTRWAESMKITLCHTRGRGHSFFPLAATVFAMKYCLCCTCEATHPILRLSDTSVWLWEPRATCWLYQWTSSCRFKKIKGIDGQCLTQSPWFFLFIWWCEQRRHEEHQSLRGQNDSCLTEGNTCPPPSRRIPPFWVLVSLACWLGKLCTPCVISMVVLF